MFNIRDHCRSRELLPFLMGSWAPYILNFKPTSKKELKANLRSSKNVFFSFLFRTDRTSLRGARLLRNGRTAQSPTFQSWPSQKAPKWTNSTQASMCNVPAGSWNVAPVASLCTRAVTAAQCSICRRTRLWSGLGWTRRLSGQTRATLLRGQPRRKLLSNGYVNDVKTMRSAQ